MPWEPSCPMRTGRHDETNSRFRNFVIAPKKNCIFFEDVMTQNL